MNTQNVNKLNETIFKKNKENINFRLTGINKYFYASECAQFTRDVMKYGFSKFHYYKNLNHLNEAIKKHGISFNKHSINIGSNQYGTDLKRFKNKDELLGYVIGYNEAIDMIFLRGQEMLDDLNKYGYR